MKFISPRSNLLGEVFTFLEEEGMVCPIMQSGIVELISQLVHYREEGRELFPEIYIVDDIEKVLQVLSPCTWIKIGDGDKSVKTMLKALKKCAPLTEGGWSIIIHRKDDGFDYGVCLTGSHLLSVSTSEKLIDPSSPEPKAIYIHQVAERLIEVRGSASTPLMVSFSSRNSSDSPIELQGKFAELIVAKMPDRFKEQAHKFFSSILLEVLQKGHGTLACIVETTKKEIPKKLDDGRILSQRIDIGTIIKDLITGENILSNRKLEGCRSLIIGMMSSDGITVFTNSGEVLGYNVFVKHSKKVTAEQTSGGARSRTYLTLCEYLGNGIEGAYIQSQDGDIKIKGRDE